MPHTAAVYYYTVTCTYIHHHHQLPIYLSTYLPIYLPIYVPTYLHDVSGSYFSGDDVVGQNGGELSLVR